MCYVCEAEERDGEVRKRRKGKERKQYREEITRKIRKMETTKMDVWQGRKIRI